MIGKQIGPYRVESKLGEGGMGEVYRARDTKLNRDVAIKVLPAIVADDSERRARFEREAQALAALNHPHIAQIYGAEEADGGKEGEGGKGQPILALVMELVEGPTLADVIATRGRLPIDEAIAIARQVADALEAAHTAGIVHRDLKPANIKVRPDGVVKVLDFGLARMVDPGGGRVNTDSPTFTSPAMTAHGVILGTAAYMAPEQARGRPVDQRADVWAFGCVLYEMLAGVAPFHGDTVTDLLAAVVRADPDWTRLPESTPSDIADLIRRCLRKDVRQRLQAIGDARIALEETSASPVPGAGASRRPQGRTVWVAAGLGGALAGAILASLIALKLLAVSPPPRDVTRFTIALPPGQTLAGLDRPAIALSDDGRQLAYVATAKGTDLSQIYVRPMDATEATSIAGTERAHNPFFSPDGRWLGFVADGKLKKIAVSGGAPQTLTDVTNSFGATWAGDHTIAFEPLGSAIQQVPDDGGTPSRLTRMLPGEVEHTWPARLPGGAGVLFAASTATAQFIAAQPLQTGNRKDFRGQIGTMPKYAPSGHLVFAQRGTLMAVPFDLQRLEIKSTAPAVPVVKGIWQPRSVPQFCLSGNGSLAYVAGPLVTPSNRLVWVSRNGVVQPLSAPPHVYYQPRLSPDGRKIVADVNDGPVQVWLYDLDRDRSAPFTFEGTNRHGIWTRDSKYVVFQSDRDGTQRLYWQRADGGGRPEPLTKESQSASDGVFNIPYSVAADGAVSYVRLVPTKNAQFLWMRLPQDAGASTQVRDADIHPFLESSAGDGAPQLSPDGHWLAYAADESGRGREIYVRAFPGPGGPWQISGDGGNEPQWNPNGKEIFYRSGRKMMAVDVDATSGFTAGRPRVLFEGDFGQTLNGYVRANYDVSPDGQRFLMTQPATPNEAAPAEITIVLNWSEELKRLVPSGR